MNVGDTIGGRYVVERRAGSGGMGTVYRARDDLAGGVVALKVVNAPPARGSGVQERDRELRFAREAETLADLSHPSIVRYIGHGMTPDGSSWLTMEWLEGEDLAARLTRGALSTDEASFLIHSIAGALAAAHARGVVHRDIKPSNVFLVGGDIRRVKLIDFGQARQSRHVVLTRTGALVGTPGYMAPEQVRGQPADARADVFGLGVVAYECLTGARLFAGDHVIAVLGAVLTYVAPDPARLPADLRAPMHRWLERVLAPAPEQRPADAREAMSELEAAMQGAAGGASEPPAGMSRVEQRVLSVLLAGTAAPNADTLASDDDTAMHAALGEIVSSFGCSLHRPTAASLIVTANATSVATDQARSVARAALALAARHRDLPAVIVTGSAVVGAGAPFGRLLDEAVALLESVPTGTVRIDAESAHLLAPEFELESSGEARVLVRERDVGLATRTLLGRPSPCVGRDRELSVLDDLFDECVAGSCARAILVIGAAGMGKSRLRYEAVQRFAARHPDTEVLLARGESTRQQIHFSMIAEAIRGAVGSHRDDPAAVRRDKLYARVSRALRGVALDRAVDRFERAIAPAHERVDVDGPGYSDAFRLSMVEWLDAESAAHPVVLVLEDLHWADVATVQLVDMALARVRGPLLVLGLARPEVSETFGDPWAKRAPTTLRLGPLTRKACDKLVRTFLSDLAAEEERAIVERAQGNPLFLEELVRSVAEKSSGELPTTVMGMLQARLAALPEPARVVLRAASVFGRTFWAGGVAHLLGRRGPIDAATLDELCAREIVQRCTPTLAGETELAYRHDLVRDAAYAMTTESDRKVGHRLAAEWLERVGASDALAVGNHYELGREMERAARSFVRAAEQALAVGDPGNALERTARAKSLSPQISDEGLLHLLEAQAHRWRGSFSDVEPSARAAVRVLDRGSAPWLSALSELAFASARHDGTEALVECAALAESAGHDDGPLDAQVRCLCAVARQLLNRGRTRDGERLMKRAESLAGTGERLAAWTRAEVHRLRGARARHAGDPGISLTHYERALADFEAASDVPNACNGRVSLAYAFIELGDVDSAASLLEESLAIAERLGLTTIAARAQQNLGIVCSLRGEHDRALELERLAVAAGAAQRDTRFEAWSRVYVSRFALRAGDAATAHDEANRAAALVPATVPVFVGALAAASRALVALGRADEALEAASRASALHTELGELEEFEAFVPLALAEAQRTCKKAALARETCRVALEKVHARARRIDDAKWRASFLERVPEHAELVALARELG